MNKSSHGDEPSNHPSKTNLSRREGKYLYPSNLPGTVLNDDEITQRQENSNQQKGANINSDSRSKKAKTETRHTNLEVIEIPFPFLQRGAKLKLQKPILKKNMLVYPLLYISVPFRGAGRPEDIHVHRPYYRREDTPERGSESFRSRFYAGLRRFYSSFISCVNENIELDDLDGNQDDSNQTNRRDHRKRRSRHRY